jgi:hypothetical protein
MINEKAPKINLEKKQPKKEEKENKFRRNLELQEDLHSFNFLVNTMTLDYLKHQSEFKGEEYSEIFEELDELESKIAQQLREIHNAI